MKVKNIILAVLGIALASAIIYSARQEKTQDKVNLKLQLKAGDSHEMKITRLENVTRAIGNRQQQQIKTHSEITVGLDVPSVDANGTMNVELFYKTIKLDINSPPQHIEFDSTNPKQEGSNEPNNSFDDALADVYWATIGSKLKITISPAGQTSDISGFDEIRAKIEEKIKKRFTADINSSDDAAIRKFQEQMAEKIAKMLASQYNSLLSSAVVSNTEELIDNIFVKLPDRTVLSGNKWKDKSYLNIGFPADANTTYTFRNRKDGCAYIDAVCDLDMGKNLKITKISNTEKISKRMSGARKSSNAVDETTGLLRKSQANMIFSGIEKIEPDKLLQPLQPDVINIAITFEGSEIIELIK
jgi:hypothetical protein